MIGFLIYAVDSFLLSGAFNLNTRIMDIALGNSILGMGTGLILSQITNITISAATPDKKLMLLDS